MFNLDFGPDVDHENYNNINNSKNNRKLVSTTQKVIKIRNKNKSNVSKRQNNIVIPCDPTCMNGVCHLGDCYCSLGYQGMDCSVPLKSKDIYINIIELLILIIIIIIIGK